MRDHIFNLGPSSTFFSCFCCAKSMPTKAGLTSLVKIMKLMFSHRYDAAVVGIPFQPAWSDRPRERNEKFIDRYQLYLIEDHRYQQIIYVLQSTPYATAWMALAGEKKAKKVVKDFQSLSTRIECSMPLIKIDRRVRRALDMRRRGCTTC